MTFKLSTTSRSRLNGVDKRLIDVIDLALTISKVDFGIPESGGYRTEQQQNELFNKGVSLCDGYDSKSYHQTGMAFDIYAYVDGKGSWNSLYLTQVATAILQAAAQLGHPLVWGGNWKDFVDMPHFEIKE